MDDTAIRTATTEERQKLADWLGTLGDAELDVPSLCSGWTVREVAAHLAVAMSGSVPTFVVQAARHRFDLNRTNEALAQQRAKQPWPQIVGTVRERAGQRLSNPGTGPSGPLADVLIHTGDMRRPLGLAHEAPADRVVAVLEFLTGKRAVGFVSRGRLDGLRLVADDLAFGSGSGAEIRGRGVDVMMAAAGRASALADLSGPGVEILAGRLPG